MTEGKRLFHRIATIAQEEERMDAMTPSTEVNPEEPGTPAALKMMATNYASMIELGIIIEQAHVSEQRAHRNTKLRLSNVETKHRRLVDANEQTQVKLDHVRAALAGTDIHGEPPSLDGDVLAEARELSLKAYNLEAELLEAKALIESATAQNANWERARREWQDRVRQVLGLPESEEAAGESHS